MSEPAENAELIKEIQHLREELNNLRHNVDHSYYSIPKNEFENITVHKISNQVTERINKRVSGWRNSAALVIVLLSFFGITQGDKLVRPMIEAEVKKQTEVLERRVNTALQETRDTRNALQTEMTGELERISRRVDERATDAANKASRIETERQLATVRSDIRMAQITVLKTELNTLKKQVDTEKTLSYQEGLRQLEPLLEQALRLDNQELSQTFLNYLFAWTYSNRTYEELDKLRVKYERDFEFTDITWANIAIGGMLLYEESNSPIYKARTVSAIENALNVSPNYGEPSAFRLIMHMIDYTRTTDPIIKAQEQQQAQDLINTLNGGSVKLTPYETYSYLSRNRILKVGPYVDKLFELFPEQMQQMETGHNTYYDRVYGAGATGP